MTIQTQTHIESFEKFYPLQFTPFEEERRPKTFLPKIRLTTSTVYCGTEI